MLIDTTTPSAPNIPLDIDARTARGSYCNIAIVSHTEFEFVLDFAFVGPNQRSGQIVSRVILHPSQALALHRALSTNVAEYQAAMASDPAPPG